MKTVDVEKLNAVKLNRKQKLLRWAGLVRKERRGLIIGHRLEYWSKAKLALSTRETIGITLEFTNAFDIAAADPVFRAAGLAGDSVGASMTFFELSRDNIHEFSCDCGGKINRDAMADRIEKMAAKPAARQPAFLDIWDRWASMF